MKTTPAIAPLLALCFALVAGPANAQHSLKDFEPGSHVDGPKLSGKATKGRVVVVEYWGITCGPCLAAIPHTTELAEKYGRDKLVIIANQVWSASDKRTKETWANRAKSDLVTVMNGGKLEGFQPRGVPRALIFDHTGKSIWEGHPGGMDRPLAEAIANLPDLEEQPSEEEAGEEKDSRELIVQGLEPEYFQVEMNMINAQNRNASSTLNKLRRAAERATEQAQIDEAKAIIAAVEAWAKKQQATIDATRKTDPAMAYTTAEELVALLRGDDLAKRAGEVLAEIRKDGKLFATVRATIMMRGLMAEAQSIGLDKDASVADDKANAKSMRLIQRDLDRLIKDFSETEAGKQAKTLKTQWGLDD